MPRFAFEARDSNGRSVTGHREAASASAVAAELSSTGVVPVRVELDDEVVPEGEDRVRRDSELHLGGGIALKCGDGGNDFGEGTGIVE